MTQAVEIHTSDRIAFKRCRRKWDFGSYMRRNLTPDRVNDKLWLGTGVHYGLSEAYKGYQNGVPVTGFAKHFARWAGAELLRIEAEGGALWEEQRDMIADQVILGTGILNHYEQWAAKNDPDWFYKVIATESDFSVPILDPDGKDTGVKYVGRIDGIVQDTHGFYWLLEHKTASAVDLSKLPLDEQCGSYIWAAQQIYGVKLEGVIYNVLRKKVPREPEMLKSGKFSQNKAIDTTAEVYEQTLIKAYGEVPPEYNDILAHLREKGNSFFVREKVYRNQQEIKNQGLRIYYEMKDMLSKDLALYPNPTKDCAWDCDFRSVCMSMEDGSDPQFMLDNMFKVRDTASPDDTKSEL